MSDHGGGEGDAGELRGTPTSCPRCAADLGLDRCPSCGLVLTGDVATQLLAIDAEVAELRARRDAAAAEVDAATARLRSLAADRFALVAPPPPLDAAPAPVDDGAASSGPPPAQRSHEVGWPPPRRVEEWQPTNLRTWLLVVGVGLLVLAGIAFAAVTWPDLSDLQRAGVLALATAVAAGCTEALRRRLPATAEALCTLTLVMVLVDWGAVRRAGAAPDIDPALWWACGQALVAGAGVLALRRGLRAPWIASPSLAVGAGLAVVSSVAEQPWTWSVGIALVATGAVIGASLLRDDEARLGRDVLQVLALAGWSLAVLAAYGDVAEQAGVVGATPVQSGGAALALLVAALPPLCARLLLPGVRRPPFADLAVGLVAACALAALTLVAADSFDGVGVLLVLGLASVGVVLLGRVGPAQLRALTVVGFLAMGPAAAVGLADGAGALLAPSSMQLDAFSRSLDVPVRDLAASRVIDPPLPVDDDRRPLLPLVALGVLLAATVPLRRPGTTGSAADAESGAGEPDVAARWSRLVPDQIVGAAGGVCMLVAAVSTAAVVVGDPTAVVPTVAGGVLAALLVGAAVALDRRTDAVGGVGGGDEVPIVLCLGACVAAFPTVLWSVLDATWAPVGIGAVAVLGAVVVAGARSGSLRRGGALGAGVLAVMALWAALEPGWSGSDAELRAWLAVAWAAVAAVGVARRAAPEGIVLEVVGIACALLGAITVLEDDALRAPVLTLVAALVTVAAAVTGRVAERRLAPLLVVVASWAWLGRWDVEVIEAFSATAALGFLGSTAWGRGGLAGLSSRAAYGWPLAIGLGPSVLAALGEEAQLRPALVTLVSLGLVAVGTQRRLRAPLEAGTVALVLLGLDLLGPVAAELPQWLTLGGSGAVLLWLGATVEHRATQVRALTERLDAFE